ncbi:3-oxoadipate enol-lactonase / 4-carboxymuconolactone decarboxylase [Actinacidiphila alni]|uniref:3-oxoadipate enol-lactonase / 4-carboxymuconolactone decarboxylase n=1 Tax=Actinacidiphila alni TaxID=380248 RepID=A0A1I2IEN7_9ACTN|nr:3-oxoadipate enol-lactonase [Actinacidiphila alni]SFF40108.1 3-oxoadipate enol-lactonase / 4-carboxymuconolactone decarboxylase [Actinacidiphila alni]
MTDLLHHRVDGPEGGPVLLLGPSLGTSLAVWDAQVALLEQHFRVVRWDLPGHGGSAADALPAGGGLGDLARRVLEVADAVGAGTFAYAGVSLGGAVGTWLAAHRPARVTALALVCSSARFGPPEGWRERAATTRAHGTGALADSAPSRWVTPAFAVAAPAALARLVADQRGADPEAYARCCEVLAGTDLRADLHRISAPTLVVAGRDDLSTPPAAHARPLADAIADAHLVELPRAAHLATLERPDAVSAALRTHFAPLLDTTTAAPATGNGAATRFRTGAGPAIDTGAPAEPRTTATPDTATATGTGPAPATRAGAGPVIDTGAATESRTTATPDIATAIRGGTRVAPATGTGTGPSSADGPAAADGRSTDPARKSRAEAGTDEARRAAGTAVRRTVLGDAHVDRAVARTTEFTAPFQDFITRYAWGEIWTRDVLDRRTRSAMTLTALIAGGHLDEFAMHVRAAVRNGLTPEEIGEVVLQSAVYCGVPAANSAFAVADRVLTELGLDGPR